MATDVARPRTRPQPPPRPAKQPRQRIAFVCLGNSCRSQMAEAWVRHLSGGRVEAVSAGVQPLGFIAPETTMVMEEKQVSTAGQRSKGLEDIDWTLVDVMVNMSPLATASLLPAFRGRRLEWKVRDPYGRPLSAYRHTRDDLEKRVRKLLAELQSSGGAVPTPVA